MIKRYFRHIQSKPTHHRRQHAVQVAGILTAVAFVVWITTLPLRFGGMGTVAGAENQDAQQTQLAGVGSVDSTNTSDDSGVQVVGTSSENSAFSNY